MTLETHKAEKQSKSSELPTDYDAISDSLMDENIKNCLILLDIPESESGFSEADKLDAAGEPYYAGKGVFLGQPVEIRVHYGSESKNVDEPANQIELIWPGAYDLENIKEGIIATTGSSCSEISNIHFEIPIPETDLKFFVADYNMFDSSTIYIERQDGNETERDSQEKGDNNSNSESKVLASFKTPNDLPDSLMNQALKNAVSLLDVPFNESGLNPATANTTDAGTSLFYIEDAEFTGHNDWSKHSMPRIVYETSAVETGEGNPKYIYLSFPNTLKENGYEDTVEVIEDIANALGIDEEPEIEGDFNEDSALAIGPYHTFRFPEMGIEIEVSNTDADAEVVIRKVS